MAQDGLKPACTAGFSFIHPRADIPPSVLKWAFAGLNDAAILLATFDTVGAAPLHVKSRIKEVVA